MGFYYFFFLRPRDPPKIRVGLSQMSRGQNVLLSGVLAVSKFVTRASRKDGYLKGYAEFNFRRLRSALLQKVAALC